MEKKHGGESAVQVLDAYKDDINEIEKRIEMVERRHEAVKIVVWALYVFLMVLGLVVFTD